MNIYNLKILLDKISEFFANTAARYHLYCEKANAEARRAAAQKRFQSDAFQLRTPYKVYAEILMAAINNTQTTTGLCTIKNISQIIHKDWLKRTSHDYYFQYRAYYMGSDLSATRISTVLQREINQLTSYYGLSPIVIQVQLSGYQGLIIRVASAASVTRYLSNTSNKKRKTP